MSTLFFVTGQPSKDRLIDALKYGDDPQVKFRVTFTVRHHSSDQEVKLKDVEVLSYKRDEVHGPVTLELFLRKQIEYLGHVWSAGVIVCTIDLSRRTPGTAHLTRLWPLQA